MGIPDIRMNLSFNGLNVLYQIANLLRSGGQLDRIMSSILQVLETHAGMHRGMISILNRDRTELVLDIAHGISENRIRQGKYRLGEGITGKVALTGKPVAIPKLKDEPTFLDRTGARKNLDHADLSFLAVPIKVIERAVLVAEGNVLDGHDLPRALQQASIDPETRNNNGTFESLVAGYEKELIIDALKDTGGNQSEAADILKTTKRIIQYKIEKYGVDYRKYRGNKLS